MGFIEKTVGDELDRKFAGFCHLATFFEVGHFEKNNWF